MPTDKQPTSFRLSDEARTMIDRLARIHGLSHTAVVEMAVRLLARRDLPEMPLPLPGVESEASPEKGKNPSGQKGKGKK